MLNIFPKYLNFEDISCSGAFSQEAVQINMLSDEFFLIFRKILVPEKHKNEYAFWGEWARETCVLATSENVQRNERQDSWHEAQY